jgi:hypothetical protein
VSAKVVIFSAANPSAVENLDRTVIEGVSADDLNESRMHETLQRQAENGMIRVWGIQPGARGYNAPAGRASIRQQLPFSLSMVPSASVPPGKGAA